ncbi:MAG: DUF2304 family protein [Candidatus Hydrogenedens sp.]|nr:DUF2304 family protein [Candidatus Hydrogenedens sp.]
MDANSIGQDGFYLVHRVGLLFASVLLVVAVLELVRRGYLKERYALLWLFASGACLLLGLFPQLIVYLSNTFGFQYLATVYVFSFLFLIAIVLAFSVVITQLSERSRTLAQELALLEQRLRLLEKERR